MFVFMLKRRIKSVIVFSLAIVLSASFFIESYANGGIAISGSFNGNTIKMVPGETFDTEGVNIVLFNNYDVDIVVDVNVRVTNEDSELVDTLIFLFEQGELGIAANTYVTIPISFEVPEDMLPGEYILSIGATLIQEYTPGIVAVPVVRQKALLEVFGEAGTFVANFFDVFGNPFTGQIDIYRQEEERLNSVISTFDQTVSDRLVPGTYIIRMVHEYDDNGFVVLEETLELKDGDDLELNYIVQTVFVDSFVIAPLVDDDNVLLNAILNYRLRNVYEEVEDVVISLEVLYRGEKVEQLVIQELTILGLGLTSLRTNYVPPEGWRNGVYTFTISVFALDESNNLIELVETDGYNINVTSIPTDALPLWLVLVGASFILALGVVIVVVVIKGKEKESDIVCLDDDPAYLEALSKLIDGGGKQ